MRNIKDIGRDKGKSLTYIPNNYIVIDIETTGLNPKYDHIIEIGAIKIKNGEVVDTFHSLIKPPNFSHTYINGKEVEIYVDDFIVELTGITNSMLREAPSISQILPVLDNFITDFVLAGHNVHFDINFLYDAFHNTMNKKLDNEILDLLRISRKLFPDFQNHKLKTIAYNFNINHKNEHRAISDCNTTYECIKYIEDYISSNNINVKEIFKKPSYKDNDLTTIKSDIDVFDNNNILYKQNIVFTGRLEKYTRKEATKIVVNLGGKVQNVVTKSTDILVIGGFEDIHNLKDSKSNKQKKAEDYKLLGQDIKIVNEDVFYNYIQYKL